MVCGLSRPAAAQAVNSGFSVAPPKPLGPKPTAAKPAPPKPDADVIVFTNGDELTGKLVSAAGGNVVFKSDMAGQLTIPFDHIKELKSGEQFALLRKGAPAKKVAAPVGAVQVANKMVTITPPDEPAAAATDGDVAYLVNKAEYEREMSRKAGFIQGWNGKVTGGATVVRSTTSGTTLTAGVSLVRTEPDVPWLPARNRTTIDVVENYGKSTAQGAIPQTTPPTPSVTTLTSIFHADGERDEYFKPTVFALADTAFDHNYAQGLSFQQIYGGGVGWTAIKNGHQQLDVKVDAHYELQKFITTPVNGSVAATVPNRSLIGSTFFESYLRDLPHKISFTETGSYLPAWNDLGDYAGNLTAALSLPVYRKLAATISSTDNYLNEPSPGYRKNSLQLVTGVTYTLP
jgi:hypothetical protein